MVGVTLEGLWMVSDRIVNFRFFTKKAPNQAKDLINMVCVTLEGLWMVSDRIEDFRFFFKFQMSGPTIIFSI